MPSTRTLISDPRSRTNIVSRSPSATSLSVTPVFGRNRQVSTTETRRGPASIPWRAQLGLRPPSRQAPSRQPVLGGDRQGSQKGTRRGPGSIPLGAARPFRPVEPETLLFAGSLGEAVTWAPTWGFPFASTTRTHT